MSSNFNYKDVPVEDICSKMSTGTVGGSYYHTLKDNGFGSDETMLCKYNTSLLDGVWAAYPAFYTDGYEVNGAPAPFAARGSAPVPLYYSNSSYTDNIKIWTKTPSYYQVQLRWLNEGDSGCGAWGAGVYMYTRSSSSSSWDKCGGAGSLGWTEYTGLLTKSPVIILNTVGGGGGGGGGAKDRSLESRRCTGGSGGSGAFCSIIVDLKLQRHITWERGVGGSGGSPETRGSDGSAVDIYVGDGTAAWNTLQHVATVGGGGGGSRGYYEDSPKHGNGGSAGVFTLASPQPSPKHYYILHSKNGVAGTAGVDASSNSSGYSSQGNHDNPSRKFGNLFNLTDNSYTGGSSVHDTNTDWSDSIAGPGGAASAMGSGGYGGMGLTKPVGGSNQSSGGDGGYGAGGGGGGCCSNDPDGYTYACYGGDGGDCPLKLFWEKQTLSLHKQYTYEITSDNTNYMLFTSTSLPYQACDVSDIVVLAGGPEGIYVSTSCIETTFNYIPVYMITFNSVLPKGNYVVTFSCKYTI